MSLFKDAMQSRHIPRLNLSQRLTNHPPPSPTPHRAHQTNESTCGSVSNLPHRDAEGCDDAGAVGFAVSDNDRGFPVRSIGEQELIRSTSDESNES